MSIFKFTASEMIGKVQCVDTSIITIFVANSEHMSRLQVNYLVYIRSSKAGQTMIGIIGKIMRKYGDEQDLSIGEEIASTDLVKVNLIGTLLDRVGSRTCVFKRTLESVPEIDSDCFYMSEESLTAFMGVISGKGSGTTNPLCIGHYTMNEQATAWLDGNKFFQRHAVIVGSTGSGKSFTVAMILEQIAKLNACNAILFDIHGEYANINATNIKHYKVAGPSDRNGEGILFLPYWLLTYEEMLALLLDRSDNNAPNQAMIFSQAVLIGKQKVIEANKADLLDCFTIDSPIPYSMTDLLDGLNQKNTEMTQGARGEKQGEYFGKLSRFIQRLEAKINDKRLNFMFSQDGELLNFNQMNKLCMELMAPACNGGGVKIIDFSEVPSDVLPLIVSIIARVVFSVQQWVEKKNQHPVALFCDEAHLYIPAKAEQSVDSSSLMSFERIAKEGRKYGVALVVISQRPSEVNHTVLSQSCNYIAMRLTNAEDQNVVKRLLPDSLGNFSDLLPILDVGEAIIVGDASLLPSRVRMNKPNNEPNSATVKFWDKWNMDLVIDGISLAVDSLRKQSK